MLVAPVKWRQGALHRLPSPSPSLPLLETSLDRALFGVRACVHGSSRFPLHIKLSRPHGQTRTSDAVKFVRRVGPRASGLYCCALARERAALLTGNSVDLQLVWNLITTKPAGAVLELWQPLPPCKHPPHPPYSLLHRPQSPTETMPSELYKAARRGDTRRAAQLLASGAVQADALNGAERWSALHLAAFKVGAGASVVMADHVANK
jgi:hypothetical protein